MWWLDGESQSGPHYWAATFAGHVLIGVGAWLILWPWLGIWAWPVAAAVYLTTIEIPQMTIAGWRRLIWDSTLDTVGIGAGCAVAQATWAQDRPEALAYLAVCAVIAGVGAWRRA